MQITHSRLAALAAGLLITRALAQDPWPPNRLVQPHELAARVGHADQFSPTVIFVGFPVLYRAARVPGAIMAGPCSKTEGIERLRNAARQLPRNRNIVLYCGCCPFVKCPNVKPAYEALRAMGFSHVQVMFLETNFHTDWVTKGYPTQKGESPS